MKRTGVHLPSILLSSFCIALLFVLCHPGIYGQVSSPCLQLDPQYDDFSVCVNKPHGYPDCATFNLEMDVSDLDLDSYSEPLRVYIRIPLSDPRFDGQLLSPLTYLQSNGNLVTSGVKNNDSYEFIIELNNTNIQTFQAIFNIRPGKYSSAYYRFFTVNLLEVDAITKEPIDQVKVLSVSWITGTESDWFKEVFKFFGEFYTFGNPLDATDEALWVHSFTNGPLEDVFIFDSNKEFNLDNVHLYIAEDMTIVVKSGAKVTMKDCLLEGCGSMWRTIKVEPGGELIMEDC